MKKNFLVFLFSFSSKSKGRGLWMELHIEFLLFKHVFSTQSHGKCNVGEWLIRQEGDFVFRKNDDH